VFFMYIIRVTLGVILFGNHNCGHGCIGHGKQMEGITVSTCLPTDFSSKTFQPRFEQSTSKMSQSITNMPTCLIKDSLLTVIKFNTYTKSLNKIEALFCR
jgi:hypothetical protein